MPMPTITISSQRPAAIVPHSNAANLQAGLLDYASRIEEFDTKSVVLDALHAIINKSLPLSVLCAARLPINDVEWRPVPGKSVFVHKDAPDGWWEEYDAVARGKFRPVLFLSRSALASFTWTEMQRLFQPIGIDRWAFELCL